jgi:hypothetical protein
LYEPIRVAVILVHVIDASQPAHRAVRVRDRGHRAAGRGKNAREQCDEERG